MHPSAFRLANRETNSERPRQSVVLFLCFVVIPALNLRKLRFLLGHKRVVGALEVLGLHADGLRLRLGLDRLVERHRPFLIEHGLGHHVREGRSLGESLGQCDGLALQHIGGHDAVEESPALALLRRHRATGEQQLGGASLANDARQHRAGAHVAAGEADAREEKGGLGRWRGETQVRSERDHRAGADARAVDRRDDRLRTGAHGLDEIAGHAREGEQPLHVACQQRADDVVHIAPEEKLPPFEATTTALMSSSEASPRNASRSSAYESNVSGFFRSGRASEMMATRPSTRQLKCVGCRSRMLVHLHRRSGDQEIRRFRSPKNS